MGLSVSEIELISIDYVCMGLPRKEIRTKHKVSPNLLNSIVSEYDLDKKRLDFVNKRIKRRMSQVGSKLTSGAALGIDMMYDRLLRLEAHSKALDKEGKMLPSSLAREVVQLTESIMGFIKFQDGQKAKDQDRAPSDVNVVFVDGKVPKLAQDNRVK